MAEWVTHLSSLEDLELNSQGPPTYREAYPPVYYHRFFPASKDVCVHELMVIKNECDRET